MTRFLAEWLKAWTCLRAWTGGPPGAIDRDYLRLVETTLAEWYSDEDERAFREL